MANRPTVLLPAPEPSADFGMPQGLVVADRMGLYLGERSLPEQEEASVRSRYKGYLLVVLLVNVAGLIFCLLSFEEFGILIAACFLPIVSIFTIGVLFMKELYALRNQKRVSH